MEVRICIQATMVLDLQSLYQFTVLTRSIIVCGFLNMAFHCLFQCTFFVPSPFRVQLPCASVLRWRATLYHVHCRQQPKRGNDYTVRDCSFIQNPPLFCNTTHEMLKHTGKLDYMYKLGKCALKSLFVGCIKSHLNA